MTFEPRKVNSGEFSDIEHARKLARPLLLGTASKESKSKRDKAEIAGNSF
jgi:hypothetical protein